VDAATVFDALPDEIRRTFLRRFYKWIDDLPGSPIQHHQYHGWEKTQYDGKYAECWVFKAPGNRLYGFLCHPKSPEDKRYELCVLVLHDSKHAHETREVNLRRAEEMRTNIDVKTAIEREFPKQAQERQGVKKKNQKKGKRK
jgi:hypothetical protein